MSQSQDDTIDFGFKRVRTEDKQEHVREVFASVASKYDIMNDVMSGGLHRIWKTEMIKQLPIFDNARLLDVAGGTGDISFRFIDKARLRSQAVEVIISDINESMLNEGRERAIDRGYVEGVDFKIANAEMLPFADNSMDYVTIAFGIRIKQQGRSTFFCPTCQCN